MACGLRRLSLIFIEVGAISDITSVFEPHKRAHSACARTS
jgi:hypothetical protein